MKNKLISNIIKIFIIIITIFIVTLSTCIITGNIKLSNVIKEEINRIYSTSDNISNIKFSYDQIKDLPEPVQKYLKYAIKEGQPYINYVKLKHTGKYRSSPNSKWENANGENYISLEEPHYLWKAKIGIITPIETFIDDQGKLEVYLFSLLKVIELSGKDADKGALLGWLGESVFFPTAFISNQYIKWEPIDTNSAKLLINYKGINAYFIVSFNEKGEPVVWETEKVGMDNKISKWRVRCLDFKEINGMIIPTRLDISVDIKSEEFTYVTFYFNTIEYGLQKK